MKLELQRAPWYHGDPTEETKSANDILNGVWSEAASTFVTMREVRAKIGGSEPMGIQPFINEVLERRFKDAGWDASDSRFRLNNTWLRITFRHQMSLGSDLLDAIRLSAIEEIEQCVLIGASLDFLRVISPKDAGVLCSFEKIVNQTARLNGATPSPLLVGKLSPLSLLSEKVHAGVFNNRVKS